MERGEYVTMFFEKRRNQKEPRYRLHLVKNIRVKKYCVKNISV